MISWRFHSTKRYQTFNIGTGFSDRQRQNPPKVGSIVVYRFQELTRDGVPRYVSYAIENGVQID